MIDNLFNNIENQKEKLSLAENYFLRSDIRDKSELSLFLSETSKPVFLKSLENDSLRNDWAQLCFKLIRNYNYSLLDLFESRTLESPEKTFFHDMSEPDKGKWSYKRIYQNLKEIAAGFYHVHNKNILEEGDISLMPRLAILSENSVVSASADLACLCYDILVTPLNVSFGREIIEYIFKELDINTVVTDSKQRIDMLISLKNSSFPDLVIFSTNSEYSEYSDSVCFIGEYEASLSPSDIETILSKRKKLSINQVCTVMFTSGSTGMPKGLSFTMYNLISKRFARGAALPDVGEDEVFLSFLPLYHTFGRYLELMGSIYWRSTYVFAGNTSSDTLLNLFPIVQPSVFISIPLRWNQLYEKAYEMMSDVSDSKELRNIFRKVVGIRLKWGLSAAGYLDPKVFEFFGLNGVELCSGFGMTEATGGITMTPPGKYRQGTVGIPLPGVNCLINSEGVLEISGHYVARYLENAGPLSEVSFPDEETYRISTGDVFQVDSDGYYEIVDRVKDIYKNNKGQTISPKNVENKFESVPGIKRTFLVGDGKPYNTLLIVTDQNEDLISQKSPEEVNDYIELLVTKANLELANYERIVNYLIIDRDFEMDKGELTPKNSFNRKNIEKNFSKEIEKLYEKNHSDYNFENLIIRIPRWFYRDLGIIESDISVDSFGFLNKRNKKVLRIKKSDIENQILIGDLIYEITGKQVNLGTLARQPKLWVGNPNFIEFSPVKDGWDTNLDTISENVFIDYHPQSINYPVDENKRLGVGNQLAEVNKIVCDMIFGNEEIIFETLRKVEHLLDNTTEKFINLLRKRLQALAKHPIEDVRCTAYRILLLDEPSPDYSKAFPAFIKSGLSYLNEKSIKEIAGGKLEIRRLEALRKRLLAYRTQIDLSNDEVTIYQFKSLFKLLINFLKNNPEFYTSVRFELISWILFNKIPEVSAFAKQYFNEMHKFYENMLDENTPKYPYALWMSKIVFDQEINEFEIDSINNVLINKAFLKQSIILCFDEGDFSINDAKDKGIWISRLSNDGTTYHYRVIIAMKNQRHYDLQIFINNGDDEKIILQTILRHVAISGYPYGYRVLPKLGAYRQELKAWSFEYFGELSLWAKIREFSSQRISGNPFSKVDVLRKYYIQAISAFIISWRNSGKQFIPGIVSPNNVIIPELDFRDGAIINSINGWKMFYSFTQFIDAIILNFYEKPVIHYTWIEPYLDKSWIFEAILNALDQEEGKSVFREISNEMKSFDEEKYSELSTILDKFITKIETNYFPTLKLISSVERYNDWASENTDAEIDAHEQTIRELIVLYNLNIKNEANRLFLYKSTYFKKSTIEVHKKFDEIINRLYRNKNEKATQLIELTELQALLQSQDERTIFAKMLFPKSVANEMRITGKAMNISGKVIINSYIKDHNNELYTMREVENVSEIGTLYRIFFKENYPKVISENDEFYILTDSINRIVGGLCYRKTDNNSVIIDGGIIIKSLTNRGLGTAMLEDFCSRMGALGYESVQGHFFLKNFYIKRGFTYDKRYGTLVRFLNNQKSINIKGNYCII
ncbi:hypothetical protein MASR1M45_15610 [Candidatus Kapaibacterium sp.]